MEENTQLSYIDKLLGDDGLKFTVTANIAPENYLYMGATIIAAVVLGHLINKVIDKSSR